VPARTPLPGSEEEPLTTPASPAETRARLAETLAWVGGRIRLRRTVRGAFFGAWFGGAVSLVWVAGWLLRWASLPQPGLLLLPIGLGAAVAAFATRLRPIPSTAEQALLLDALFELDEAATTAVEMEAAGVLDATPLDPRARQILQRLDVELPPTSAIGPRLPPEPPRHARFLPVLLLALTAALFLPRVSVRVPTAGTPGDLADEAERLQERKEELEQQLETELPAELEEAFSELVDDMKAGSIDAEQASARADELREKLDELAKEASQESGDGSAAADALESVDPDAAQDMQDALRQGDLDAAASAVESMRERMAGASEADRERAARELERAGQQAANSGRKELADALRREAARTRQQGQQGQGQDGQGQDGQGQDGQDQQGQDGQGQDGQDGQGQDGQEGQGQDGQGQQGQDGQSQQGQNGQGGQQDRQGQGQGGQRNQQGQGQQGQNGQGQQGQGQGQQPGDGLAEYLRRLDQQGVGGEQLAQQQRQMAAAQELNNALGGAQGRLGQGQSGGNTAGRGQQGQQGQGSGEGRGPQWGAGTGHTDAVADPFSTDGAGHNDADRQVDGSHSSWVVEEFGDNPEERLENIRALTQSVNAPLGDGPVESWDIRLERGDETAATPLSGLPPSYRAAAEEAVDGESVPRAYRDQVKQYFDVNPGATP